MDNQTVQNSIITFKFSPSGCVENYFSSQCLRSMFYKGIESCAERKKLLGLNAPAGTGSNVAAAAGDQWERDAVKILKRKYGQKYIIEIKRDEDGSLADISLKTLKDAINSTASDRHIRYIYQPTLKITESFCRENMHFPSGFLDGTDPFLRVKLSSPRPDLLRVSADESGAVTVSVVDMKLAKRMKLEHKVQITLYTRILFHMLAEADLTNVTVDREYGYLWNYGQEKESAFSIKDIDGLVDDYLVNVLPPVLEDLHESLKNGTGKRFADSLDVCVGSMCEYCENYPQCNEHLKKMHSIQLMPYLSSYAQRYIKLLGLPYDLEGFKERIQEDDIREALKGNRSWKELLADGTALDVLPYAFSEGNDPASHNKWKNARTFGMPKWQDVIIILTAQKDIGTDRIYALGYHVSVRKGEVPAELKEQDHVFIAADRSDKEYIRSASEFVKSLYSCLKRIEAMRITAPDGKSAAPGLQAYVMDGYELKNLEELLFDLLENIDVSRDADTVEAITGILF